MLSLLHLGGKAGLSNKEDNGEGSEDRVEHKPLLYQSLREASVSGEGGGIRARSVLYPHRSARRSTGAKSCSMATEAFRRGQGNHSRMRDTWVAL